MPFSLTCACGARLEIDDKFAGQQITCPDCQRPVQAPKADQPARRTSGLALTSLVLALVGAFTVVGTVVAIVLGALALVQMAGRSDRLAGRGYAIAGILVGIVMTGGTVFALTSIELFGLTGMMSNAYWAGKLDYGGTLEVVREKEGFAIKRPSEKWGVYKTKQQIGTGDPAPIDDRFFLDDLLLVFPDEDAVVLCFTEAPVDKGIEECRDIAFRKVFEHGEKFGLFTKESKGLRLPPRSESRSRPPPVNDVQIVEERVSKKVGSEDKTFLMRVLKKRGDNRMFVIVAGTRQSHFGRMQSTFRQMMDSFRILDPNLRRD
jgi:hypothetical protein